MASRASAAYILYYIIIHYIIYIFELKPDSRVRVRVRVTVTVRVRVRVRVSNV